MRFIIEPKLAYSVHVDQQQRGSDVISRLDVTRGNMLHHTHESYRIKFRDCKV